MPRWATPLRPDRPSNFERLEAIAAEFGLELLPWQRYALQLIGELLTEDEALELGVPFGTPAYREVWLTVPRQSGKTTVQLVAAVDRCLFWRGVEDSVTDENGDVTYRGRVQRVVYTAQSGVAARDKLVSDFEEDFLSPPPAGLISDELVKITRGMANTSIKFRDGRIMAGANSESSGHGKTLDLALIDEAWHDDDSTRQGALTPAMITRDTAQIIGSSTAGTQASVYFNEKQRIGRLAAEGDAGTGIAYLEYSADAESADFDPYDEDMWHRVHPAVGLTQSVLSIRTEAQGMELDEFKRAYLNITNGASKSSKIDLDRWSLVCSPSVGALDGEGELVWSYDSDDDQTDGAIVAARRGSSSGPRVELVDCSTTGEGVQWIPGRLNELIGRYGGIVVYDAGGPAEDLARDITGATVGIGNQGLLQACSGLQRSVDSGLIHIRKNDHFDAALRAAGIRISGDRWAWVRRNSSVNAAPLFALTMAACADTAGASGGSWVI